MSSTLTSNPGASADDGTEEPDGDTQIILNYGPYEAFRDYLLIRFPSISGLAGMEILDCYVELDITFQDGLDVDVYAELAESPAQVSAGTANNDISGRTLTTAKVTHSVSATGVKQFSGLESLIQEIVDAGHDPDAIAIVWTNPSGGGFNYKDYDGSGTPQPELYIEYQEPSTFEPQVLQVQLTF